MTYRSADGVLRERLAELERAEAERDARERALIAECEESERAAAVLAERLAVSGPGGAARGPSFDRIGVLVAALCVVGLLVVPAEIHIGGWVHRSPGETILPILLLGGPGVLAAVIAWPYRRQRGYRSGVVAGVLLVSSALLNVLVGFYR
jgi:hypothetical protein